MRWAPASWCGIGTCAARSLALCRSNVPPLQPASAAGSWWTSLSSWAARASVRASRRCSLQEYLNKHGNCLTPAHPQLLPPSLAAPPRRPQPAVGAAGLPGGLHPVHLLHDRQGDEAGGPGGRRLVRCRWAPQRARGRVFFCVQASCPCTPRLPPACAAAQDACPPTCPVHGNQHLPTRLLAPHPPGEYDLRGVRGEPGVDARFRRIQLQGTFDGPLSQADLDRIAEQVGGGGG